MSKRNSVRPPSSRKAAPAEGEPSRRTPKDERGGAKEERGAAKEERGGAKEERGGSRHPPRPAAAAGATGGSSGRTPQSHWLQAASGTPVPRTPNTSPDPPRRDAPRRTLIVAVTGASGAAYAARLVECAVRAGRRVHLIVTKAGRLVLADELGAPLRDARDLAPLWPPEIARHVEYTPAEKIGGGPASGSYAAEATVVIPCSMNTLAALAHGLAGNLVQRAASVALKEGRPLVVVPREMPVTTIDLENMARLASAGATVMPAMPGFYHRPRTVADLVDFVVAKVLDRLGIAHDLAVRWPGSEKSGPGEQLPESCD